MQDSFWSMTKMLVKKDRKKERKKLIEAFNFLGIYIPPPPPPRPFHPLPLRKLTRIISHMHLYLRSSAYPADPKGEGVIDKKTWCRLMRVVKPNVSADAHEWLFARVDKNGDGIIDIIDWLDVRPHTYARRRVVAGPMSSFYMYYTPVFEFFRKKNITAITTSS